MKKQNKSMQSKSMLAQSQQTLDRVHNAVSMAQSHPNEQMIEQAENAIERAERTARQIKPSEDPNAVALVQSELRDEKENLHRLQ